jgi:hypothetical protein
MISWERLEGVLGAIGWRNGMGGVRHGLAGLRTLSYKTGRDKLLSHSVPVLLH